MFIVSRWFQFGAAAIPVVGLIATVAPKTNSTNAPRTNTEQQFLIARSVSIAGTVRDMETGRAIEGAQIAIASRQGRPANASIGVQSDAQGRYALQFPASANGDSVTISARRIGYAGSNQTIALASESITLEFKLKATPATIAAVTVGTTEATSRPYLQQMRVESERAVGAAQGAASQRVSATPSIPPALVKQRVDESRGKVAKVVDKRERTYDSSLSYAPSDREQYDRIEDNPFLAVRGNPRSTFSIDVDRAAYGNVRRFLTQGQKPPADAVRIEEMVNYFPYELNQPRGKDPIAITTEVASAPWQTRHRLVRVALQARRINMDVLPPSNLVFLIDVSGSMSSPDKLPLVKQSLRMLVDQMREQDRVAIVVYAGNAGLVLPSTPGSDKARIAESIDRLEAGGSTAGGAGIQLAYKVARENFQREGNNRVILATDGDFNVGASSDSEMERLIESKRGEGTYLTVLGFGTGNYQDAKMEKLAKKGNGNYAYIDNIDEARKTLVHELGATLVTVANDVKLQVEFNPAVVSGYRLIGYEDRLMRDEDFNDDRKDAGDIGSGHAVTALYEVVPVGVTNTVKMQGVDALRYPDPKNNTATTRDESTYPSAHASADEMMYVKLRYKTPGDSTSKLMTRAVSAQFAKSRTSDDFRFAASVASFGMLLRDSEYKGTSNSAQILEIARGALGEDEGGYRAEFVRLVERWQVVTRGIANRD